MKLYKQVYHKACALERSKLASERAFSVLLHKASHALHDIETGENPTTSILAALQVKNDKYNVKQPEVKLLADAIR